MSKHFKALGPERVLDHPLHHAALRQVIDTHLSKHVEALCPVMHRMSGHMSEHTASAEGKSLAFARPRENVIVRTSVHSVNELIENLIVQFAQFINRSNGIVLKPRTRLLSFGEHISPPSHGTQHMGQGPAEGPQAHLELLIELLIAQCCAGFEQAFSRPAVKLQEDLAGDCGRREQDARGCRWDV